MHTAADFLMRLARRFALVACLVVLQMPPASAENSAVTEYHVKAAFLYNFSRFVSWPQPIQQTFRLCIIGDNPFGSLLDSLIGKTVNDSVLVVEEHATLENIHECQIAYISHSLEKRLKPLLGELQKYPVLTVSDIESFTDSGGMIGLTLSGNKVRFDINANAAGKTGLSISSKLLSLATNVRSGQ